MNKNLFNRLLKDARRRSLKKSRIVHITYILDGNRIVAIGINSKTTHPASPHNYKQLHSELDAVLNIRISDECKKYHFKNIRAIAKRYSVFNVRVMKNGSISIAKPCKSCIKMLRDLQFKKIYFTNKGGMLEQL